MSIYPDCKYPTCGGLRGYVKGCRCDRCKHAKSESAKRYYDNNRDKVLERVLTYQEDKLEQRREYAKEHYKKNKSKYIANAKKRKALQYDSYCELTREQQLEIYDTYKRCREITEKTGIEHHVDHIKPLSKGGLHHPDNLQILTAKENMMKKAKWDGSSGK